MYETLCRQYVYFAVMYFYNPGLWGPCYGYLSILICLCPCRVAARRWYAGYLCVLFSSLWVGPLSQTWLRDLVGTSRATSPLITSRASLKTRVVTAMEEEMKSLERNKTWSMVDLPKGSK